MNTNTRRLLLVAALATFPFSRSFAIPANPRPIVRIQPDGSSVTVTQRGDEAFHYVLSSDGYLLLPDSNGVLRYANSAAGISAYQAHDPSARTVEEAAFLSTLDAGSVVSLLTSSTSSRKPGRKPTAIASTTATSSLVNRPRRWAGSAPDTGTVRGLVLLVQFSDSTFKVPNPQAEYTNYMNEVGYSNYGMTGSVRDYFIAASDSQFKPTFDVFGPVTLGKPASYYGGNYQGTAGWDTAIGTMVTQACQKLKNSITWAKYDNDGDGYVDFVYVFYAGRGEADGGAAASIWPQAGHLETDINLGGKWISHYAVSNERSGSATSYALDGIGSFCHEFSHVLGLPDIYQTASGTTLYTPAYWDIMDIGVYNCANTTYGNSSCTPPYLNALERYTLGWLTPTTLASSSSVISLANIATNTGLIVPSSHDSEFFLLENRQESSWDAGLPGHGMLVWHVNYDSTTWNNNEVNNTSLRVDVQEADGVASYGDAGDPFPGTSRVKSAKFATWGKDTLRPSVYNIAESNGIVCFTTTSATKTIACTDSTTAVIAGDVAVSRLSVRGTDLLVPASSTGSEGRVLNLYAMDGRLVRSRPVSSAQASISLAALGGRGMLVARLVEAGNVRDQRTIILP